MKRKKHLLLGFIYCLTAIVHSQNYIKENDPVIGKWELTSPKKSPGPEFVPETYIGIAAIKLSSGQFTSIAASTYNKEERKFVNYAEFIAEWDGNKLTGKVSFSSWVQQTNSLQINVPLEYDPKKDQVIIHIDNPEYGNVKFIYKRIKN